MSKRAKPAPNGPKPAWNSGSRQAVFWNMLIHQSEAIQELLPLKPGILVEIGRFSKTQKRIY